MSKVIAVLDPKGGVGKSTLATNLAVTISRAGESVVLLDADSQGSASDWAAAGGSELVKVEQTATKNLPRFVSRHDSDVIVIDGPPHASDVAGACIRVAGFVLIPVQPSPLDVWAARPVVEALQAAAVPAALFYFACNHQQHTCGRSR